MVPILYFSVVTRGNIIVFGHKFLAMAQKAYEYSCSQGSLFLMDGLKIFFWPIKLILPIKVVFKIFRRLQNTVEIYEYDWLNVFSEFPRIFFSMIMKFISLFAVSACQPPHQLFFWLLYHNLCSNLVFNTITPLGFPARVAYLDVTRQEFSFVASSLRVVDQHLLAIDLTSTRQEVSSRYVISILWVLSNEK